MLVAVMFYPRKQPTCRFGFTYRYFDRYYFVEFLLSSEQQTFIERVKETQMTTG